MSRKLTFRQARRLANLTMKEISEKLKITELTYRNKEVGKSSFTLNEARRFSKIVDVPLEDLEEEF